MYKLNNTYKYLIWSAPSIHQFFLAFISAVCHLECFCLKYPRKPIDSYSKKTEGGHSEADQDCSDPGSLPLLAQQSWLLLPWLLAGSTSQVFCVDTAMPSRNN